MQYKNAPSRHWTSIHHRNQGKQNLQAACAGLRFQNIAPYFAPPFRVPGGMILPDVSSASTPARSRRAALDAQRRRRPHVTRRSTLTAAAAAGATGCGLYLEPAGKKMEDPMKRVIAALGVALGAVVFLFPAAIPARAQSHELLQGTEVRLRLLTRLSTAVSKSGDPFLAEVTGPVYLGNQMVLPAGARVRGTVGGVIHTRHFSIFRGQAAMNLSFRDLEVDSRVYPAKMSILQLDRPSSGDREGKRRKDVKVDEGQVVEERHDVKGDVIGGAIGVGGGSLVGVVFSNVARGFGFGMVGAAVYIVERKGKEVELPADTVIRVRMDNTVTLPRFTADNGEGNSPRAAAE
jgi:hypothetical protein